MTDGAGARGPRRRGKRVAVLLAVVLFACLFVVSSGQIATISQERRAATQEYTQLQKRYGVVCSAPIEADVGAGLGRRLEAINGLKKINPDFVGWLKTADGAVDYPIVQGADNDHYLHTTFEGERNPAGAIFMDAEIQQGLDAPHVIIYGHNMQNGTMFGMLHQYLQAEYLENNPELSVTGADGKRRLYQIFDAKVVPKTDPCYQISFQDEADFTAFLEELGAPADVEALLTLSTCGDGSNQNERVVVRGVLLDEEREEVVS